MPNNLEKQDKLPEGITGNYSGTIGGLVFTKNGVIRRTKYTNKRKRRKKNENY